MFLIVTIVSEYLITSIPYMGTYSSEHNDIRGGNSEINMIYYKREKSIIMNIIFAYSIPVWLIALLAMVGFLTTFQYLLTFAYSMEDLVNHNGIAWYDKALAMNHDNVPALVEKGTYLVNSGRSQQAIAYLDKALEIDPTNMMALTSKGAALRDMGQYHQAIEVYDKILKIDSKDLYAMGGKADSLYGLGHIQQGISWIDKALEIDPNNPTILQVKYMLNQASD